MNKHKNQKGNSFLVIVGAVLIVAIVGMAIYKAVNNKKSSNTKSQPNTQSVQTKSTASNSSALMWQQTESGWQATGEVQKCASKLQLNMPVKTGKVVSVLYPGQTRGGNYKPHGGFRFIDGANGLLITAPYSGFLVRGARYLSEGEVQYTFDVMTNCGVMYRLGHLRELPDKLMAIANTWPEPIEGDSRTQQISPAIPVKQGDIFATKVGILASKNSFFDFGVYDYREQNNASKSPEYQAVHQADKSLSWYATCWFNWMPQEDYNQLLVLPAADPTSGKTSDYCK